MGREVTRMKNRYPKIFDRLNLYHIYYYAEFRCGMSFLKLPDGKFLYFTKRQQY